MSATVHEACGSPSDRVAIAVSGRFRHSRSVRSVAGPHRSCRGGRAFFKAGWLLAVFLGLNVLLAHEPAAPPTQTERGVAQIFNLPYRRIASCAASAEWGALGFADALPIADPRYSRLQICATSTRFMDWEDRICQWQGTLAPDSRRAASVIPSPWGEGQCDGNGSSGQFPSIRNHQERMTSDVDQRPLQIQDKAQEPPDKSDSSPRKQPESGKAPEPASPDTESKTVEPAKSDPPPPAPVFKHVKRDDFASVFSKVVPTSLADLESIQRHVEALTAQVSPAVVAVRVGFATGSGVVISKDGTVLSAAHVCVSPGRDVVFTFPDGKTARGKTLGTNHEIDAGLMKITDPGSWPHTEVGELEYARLGDWVLALGHPGGFDRKRPVVARLGRVILLAPGVVQSDCTLIGGDSGGPLFDMHGRVIGIHSRISDSTAANFHVPIGTFHETWDRLAKGESWGDQRPRPQPSVGAGGVADPAGCKLDRVDEGGPASRAGLKVGDIVMKVNGQEVKDFDSFLGLVRQSRRGEELTLVVKREDKEMTMKMRLGFGRRGR